MHQTAQNSFSFPSVRNKFSNPSVRNKFSIASPRQRAFIVAFFFVTFASGLFWLDFFRGYDAEVTLLIVSKTETAAMSLGVAEDVAELVRTLAFFDRVLAGNDLIDDASDGYSLDERKAFWNDTVSVKHPDGSGVLVIRARAETPEKAKRLAAETARTAFSVIGFYYNVKTDIDARIVDGPIVSTVITSVPFFGVASVVSGFLVTALFFSFLNIAPRFIRGQKTRIPLADTQRVPGKAYPEFLAGESVPWIDPRKFIPARPDMLSFERSLQETSDVPLAPVSRGVASAPAPANLPIADADAEAPLADADAAFPFAFESPAEESEAPFPEDQEEMLSGAPSRDERSIGRPPIEPQASEPVSADANLSEPTVDEYKRRLNELLSGSR